MSKFADGEQVQCKWDDGEWYDAIVNYETDEGYYITFPEYGSSHNYGLDRIRKKGGAAPPPVASGPPKPPRSGGAPIPVSAPKSVTPVSAPKFKPPVPGGGAVPMAPAPPALGKTMSSTSAAGFSSSSPAPPKPTRPGSLVGPASGASAPAPPIPAPSFGARSSTIASGPPAIPMAGISAPVSPPSFGGIKKPNFPAPPPNVTPGAGPKSNAPWSGLTPTPRNDVIIDLAESEKVYVDCLKLIVDLYIDPLNEQAGQKGAPLKTGEITTLFSSLQSLLSMNQAFSNNLADRLCNWRDQNTPDERQTVSDIINPFISQMRSYQAFFSSSEASFKLLDQVLNESKYENFQIFCDKAMANSRSVGRSISSLLILPYLRVFRYRSIFKDLMTHCQVNPSLAAELVAADNAYRFNQNLQDSLNENVKRRVQTELLKALEEKFVLNPSFVAPNRYFIRSGPVMKETSSGPQKMEMYLFNNLLAFGTPSGWKFTLKGKLNLDSPQFKLTDRTEPNGSEPTLLIQAPEDSFHLYFRDVTHKNIWLRDIEEVRGGGGRFGTLGPSAAPAFNNRGSNTISGGSSSRGSLNSKDEPCSVCAKNFGLFNRKYTCKSCMKGVCDPCSKSKMILPHLPEKVPKRVCDSCLSNGIVARTPPPMPPPGAPPGDPPIVILSAPPPGAIVIQAPPGAPLFTSGLPPGLQVKVPRTYGPIATWSNDDLLSWLNEPDIDFGSLVPVCKQFRVDGSMIMKMTEDDLKTELKMEEKLARMRLLDLIGRLKAPAPPPMSPTNGGGAPPPPIPMSAPKLPGAPPPIPSSSPGGGAGGDKKPVRPAPAAPGDAGKSESSRDRAETVEINPGGPGKAPRGAAAMAAMKNSGLPPGISASKVASNSKPMEVWETDADGKLVKVVINPNPATPSSAPSLPPRNPELLALGGSAPSVPKRNENLLKKGGAGGKTSRFCPECGEENTVGGKFCAECGTALPVKAAKAADPEPEAKKPVRAAPAIPIAKPSDDEPASSGPPRPPQRNSALLNKKLEEKKEEQEESQEERKPVRAPPALPTSAPAAAASPPPIPTSKPSAAPAIPAGRPKPFAAPRASPAAGASSTSSTSSAAKPNSTIAELASKMGGGGLKPGVAPRPAPSKPLQNLW